MIEHKFPLDISPADLEQWLSPEEVINIDPLPGRLQVQDLRQF